MILADKLIALRKKEGMTQEDLAAEVGVSRQSVSKWESQMAMPDLDKIIKLSKIFGVSTDFLLNEELGMEQIVGDSHIDDTTRIVDLDTVNAYFTAHEKIAKLITIAFPLFIISPIPVMALDGGNEGLGVTILLIIIALAVGLCINAGFAANKFEFLEKEAFNFSYGIEGIIEKKKEDYEPSLKRNVIIAVILFIVSPAVFMLLENIDTNENIAVYLFLLLIAIGVGIITHSMIKYTSYTDIIQYSKPKTTEERKEDKLSGMLWVTAIGIYLVYSLLSGNWNISWVIFVIAVIIQVIISIYYE